MEIESLSIWAREGPRVGRMGLLTIAFLDLEEMPTVGSRAKVTGNWAGYLR